MLMTSLLPSKVLHAAEYQAVQHDFLLCTQCQMHACCLVALLYTVSVSRHMQTCIKHQMHARCLGVCSHAQNMRCMQEVWSLPVHIQLVKVHMYIPQNVYNI